MQTLRAKILKNWSASGTTLLTEITKKQYKE